jgi:hypothetical protein
VNLCRNLAAEEFSFAAVRMMAGFVLGFALILSIALILWA